MEFTATKRSRRRKRKRHLKKLRDQAKIKVRFMKHRRIFNCNSFDTKETKMQADSFWKNYKVAQEWQTRHNITWWRSRCIALEYENEILRNKVRFLAYRNSVSNTAIAQTNRYNREINNENDQEEYNLDEDNIEFNMTEEMLEFFEKAERHRRELKKQRKSEASVLTEEVVEETPITGGAMSAQARKEEAILLYGDASAKILAMETALQATVDRHKDKGQPQYWPNIPLKP